MIKRNKAYNQFIFFQLEGVSVKQGDNLVQKDSVNTELIKTELEKNSVSFAFVDGRIIDVCEHNGKLKYDDYNNRSLEF